MEPELGRNASHIQTKLSCVKKCAWLCNVSLKYEWTSTWQREWLYSAVLNAAEEYISYTVVLQRSEGIKKRVCYKTSVKSLAAAEPREWVQPITDRSNQ